jgi:hypothetical protein
MTTDVATATSDMTLRDANIHRVLVIDGDDLGDIVTTTDVVMAVADHKLKNRTCVFA